MLKFVPVFNAPPDAREFAAYSYLARENKNDQREVVVGVVEIEEELQDVGPFKPEHVTAASVTHGIALHLPHEDFGAATDFTELKPIIKLFVEGVEVQLRRKVLFVGGSGLHWLTVPLAVKDRYYVEPEAENNSAQ